MKELFVRAAVLVLMGLLCGAGVRAAEWLIPKPETRVVVCMYDDIERLACRSAAELIEKMEPR